MTTLVPVPARAARCNLMVEEARWCAVAADGEAIGDVIRIGDGTKRAWMAHPPNFPEAFVDPAAASGYSRTSRKECAAILERWRENMPLSREVDGQRAHLLDGRFGRSTWYVEVPADADARHRWFAVHVDRQRDAGGRESPGWAAHAIRWATARPWHARRVYVSLAATPDEALELAVREAARPASEAEEGLASLLRNGSWADDQLGRVHGSLLDVANPSAVIRAGANLWGVERADGGWDVGAPFSPPLWTVARDERGLWRAGTPGGREVVSAGELESVLGALGVTRAVSQAELPALPHPAPEGGAEDPQMSPRR